MACRDWAAKVGGGVLGRVWALVAALALLLGLAAMAPAPAQAASFKDVPSGQWYTSWVDKASDQGLMSGFTDPATGRPTGYFGPDEPLTRAQVATVLWRMAGGPSSGHASFPDVERGSWYDAPVAWCVKAGVVTGYTSGPDKGCFRPDRPVTRQELATMVHRYAKYAGMDVADPDPTAFRSTTDWRTVDSWASEALTWTAAAGVLSGVDNHDGTYSVVPFGTATRAMAAKVFVVLSGSPSPAKASYTVTFNSNGGSDVKAQAVRSGAKASRPADPAKSGCLFKGWYSDKSLTKACDFNFAVKSNLTLYAKWEKKAAYTVAFNVNGGTAVKAQSVSSGAKASKPANPTKDGYVFKGWYSDKSLAKVYDFNSAVKSNLTLYAKWEANKYTVTFVSNGGTSVAKQTVAYGAKASRPSDPTRDGYSFAGWCTDKSLTRAYDFDSAVGSDLTLYAKWRASAPAASYTVVFVSNGGSAVEAQTVEAGRAAVEPPAPTRPNFVFKGWRRPAAGHVDGAYAGYVDGTYTASGKGIGGEVPVTVTVKDGMIASVEVGPNSETRGIGSRAIEQLPAKIVEANGLEGVDAVSGATVTSKAIFSAVYECLAPSTAAPAWPMYDFGSPVESDITLFAAWAPAVRTVSFDSRGGTPVGPQGVEHGAKASRPSDPTRDGYSFAGWCTDKSLTRAYDFDSAVGSDLTLYAKWRANKYTVTFVSNGGTSVAKQTVAYGAKASKPSDPTLDGSAFAGWYSDKSLTKAYDFNSVVKSNFTLYAKWTMKSQPYAVLYKDGLLSLQAGSDTDPSHGEVIGKWVWDGSSRPWCDKRARVRSVVARDRVAVSNGDEMFRDLANCWSMDLSRLDVSGASDLSDMFSSCSSLTSLDVSGWDVSGASSLSGMFFGCSRLQSLDVSGWDVSGASNLSSMFSGCSSLGTVTLGAGCGPLVGELPSGPWYDAEGKEYDRPPAGVAGTFTKTKPAALAVAADGVSDAGALLPAQIVEGEQDGLRYVVVPEGAPFEYGIEYPELAGRYVGPGAYLTGYAGESDSLVVPLEVAGVPVVSANLSWNDSDRVGMTKLAAVSFERVEGKASSLAQLDVSGNGLSSLDIEGLDSLVRLNCEGNPIADLAALQTWAAQDGHEAKLPQVQDAAPAEPGDAVAPSEPSAPEQPSEPDVPAVEPGEPLEPEVPAEPNVPGEPSEPEVPSEPEAPVTPEVPSEPEEPSEEPTPDEGSSDEPAASDEGDPASDSLALGEDPDPALAA